MCFCSEHYSWQPERELAWTRQQQRNPQSKVKYSSQGYALESPPGQTQLGSGYARLNTLSFVHKGPG